MLAAREWHSNCSPSITSAPRSVPIAWLCVSNMSGIGSSDWLRLKSDELRAELFGAVFNEQSPAKSLPQANRQLIPEVSGDAKRRVLALLRDYAQEIPSCLNGLMPSPEAFAETKTRSVSNQEIAGAARAVRDD
ncbi:unnamed protein product, partial [Polarella glacialis]